MDDYRYVLDPRVKAQLARLQAEREPLTDEQLDALCDVLVQVRLQAGR
jgi:hypothetical protein